ncbi:helix-turn-helix transcriptional regulator [Clostridium polynesiense]|uniref:helix-turn-helix transcriptional regulator n=1 Tax=Clostridium polynesiense TaxID=1325933 RepID=UPI00058E2AB3|nr:helix-turn-helix transcriptional regulator [Clostridium polynesiense]
MKFLTQGEKLKKLRIELNLRQKDLADENVTREFISMVEKEKRNFSRQNAISVMRRILSIAAEKGIELNLDEEYIYRDIKQDAERYCIQRVEDNASLEECEELLKISDDYNVPYAKYKVYKRMGDLVLFNQEPIKAFIYYSEAMEILNLNNYLQERPSIFNNMGVCKLKLIQYEEAILYFTNALYISELDDSYGIYNRVAVNLSLAYINIGKIEECLSIIEEFSTKIDKDKENIIYIKMELLRANCYEYKKDYEKCLGIYWDLLDGLDINNIFQGEVNKEYGNLLGIIYNNMANVLLIQEKYDESEIYFDKSYDVRINYDIEWLSHSLIEKSRLYIKWLEYDKAEEVIYKGIELCKKYNDYEYWLIALKELEKIYSYNKNYEELINVYTDLIKLSDKNEIEKHKVYALNKLIKLEVSLNNMEKVQYYSNKLDKYIELMNKV